MNRILKPFVIMIHTATIFSVAIFMALQSMIEHTTAERYVPKDTDKSAGRTSDKKAFLHELQDDITDSTLHPTYYTGDTVEYTRPRIQQHLLQVHGNPTIADNPGLHFDTLRIAEEALRRPILRALGHLATEPLLEHAISTLDGPAEERYIQDTSFTFMAEASRGRVHRATRGELVARADKRLRAIADLAFCKLAFEKESDLYRTFWDISQRVREFSGLALDHRVGEGWRDLDPTEVSLVQVTKLRNGQPLSRYDRHLLIKTQKPLDIRQSFGNATATTAEFAAISIEAMSRALSQAGSQRPNWYPQAFANLNKLSFGARLPFWAAQDLAIAANDFFPPELFRITSRWPSRHHVEYAQTAHRNYDSQEIAGACQGILPSKPEHVTHRERLLGRRLLSMMRRIAGSGEYIAWHDVPDAAEITSVDAATALTLSIAYKGQYSL
ncbi:hypothetical protein PV379_01260 [Streptomyces caniscabiei]|uniref:hypothetical protein n=1 Tax=Streptomyces caniscabiei TaxID=2746961 RepID=UPI0029B8EE03|nr:hypothetical protein [Streptomyces caniscabiei]MDX2775982.1 hypothetical protein [Streptomyces caniscabiei]